MIPELKYDDKGTASVWMKKGKYFERCYGGCLIETDGYIDNEQNIAYRDNEALIMSDEKWIATDTETGLKIATGRNFEDLYNTVQSMQNVIKERKETQDYRQWKRQFKMILDGDLGELITQ